MDRRGHQDFASLVEALELVEVSGNGSSQGLSDWKAQGCRNVHSCLDLNLQQLDSLNMASYSFSKEIS